ncbi:MAG: hypothetical protein Q4F95_01770 [Oscillospiraceae bacterium]|nr:hypothetical protein [Oscillospiraceae bacterium]
MTKFKKYWILTLALVLAASFYPLYMGVKVVSDMIVNHTVDAQNYPKYIIPYTPISLTVILCVALMPLIMKPAKKYAFLTASVLSTVVFFLSELLLETKVIVTSTVETTLESWQMFMCYVPPESQSSRTWTPVDVLIGDYSPAFKIHFYLISMILIITILNCIYGFAEVVATGCKKRVRALTVQSVCTAMFLGLCILACFTAFFRNGDIYVSPLSAALMILFFISMSVTAGVFAGSFFIGEKKLKSVIIPAVTSAVVTLFMYIGEMILLSRHLYRFARGFFFDALPRIVLAPVDIVVIFLSGFTAYFICQTLNKAPK